MSSAKKIRQAKRHTPKRWNAYVEEADLPDFVLEVDDDRNNDIRIKCPTGEALLAASEAQENQNLLEALTYLCGDALDEVLPLVKAAPHPALLALIEDINEHFELAGPTS